MTILLAIFFIICFIGSIIGILSYAFEKPKPNNNNRTINIIVNINIDEDDKSEKIDNDKFLTIRKNQ